MKIYTLIQASFVVKVFLLRTLTEVFECVIRIGRRRWVQHGRIRMHWLVKSSLRGSLLHVEGGIRICCLGNRLSSHPAWVLSWEGSRTHGGRPMLNLRRLPTTRRIVCHGGWR